MQTRSLGPRWGLVCLAALIFTMSCSTGPQPPQPGTPAFYWAAAQHTFETGDYLKASTNLEKLTDTPSDYTARAEPWRLVLTSGIATGLMEVADSYEKGARAKKSAMGPLLTEMAKHRNAADREALQCVEAFLKFKKSHQEPTVELAFGYPKGSPLPVQGLTKIAGGILIPPAELETIEKQTIERSVLMMTSRAVGAEGNPAKAQEVFRATPVRVPRETFFAGMAATLSEFAEFYDARKLDRPDRRRLFLQQAVDALTGVPDTKETKQLKTKIQRAMKKLPKS